MVDLTVFCYFLLIMLQKETVFYIIGDSTVRNGDGTGKNQQWGWGSMITDYFDTARSASAIMPSVEGAAAPSLPRAVGIRYWQRLKKGDYVIMQFGHNDAGPLDDTARARGTIRGIGEESKEIYNPITKKQEVVYTYGWYMSKYIRDTKAKGAIAIVCSPIPRNNWKDGKVTRSIRKL